jgi:hypothetical protein
VEIFFRILKSGCRVEALQLGTVARLERALVIYLINPSCYPWWPSCRPFENAKIAPKELSCNPAFMTGMTPWTIKS